MAGARLKHVVGMIASSALMFSSTGALASSSRAQPQISPWATLTVLSGGAPAAAICGAAVSAEGRPAPTGCVLPVMDAAPPVASALPSAGAVVPAVGFGVTPLLLGLSAIAVGVGLFFAVNGDSGNNQSQPNSPG